MTQQDLRTELRPGYSISRIINGGWQLSAGHGRAQIDKEAFFDDMLCLVEAGFTSFDCADIYTGVEELLGGFVQEYRRRTGDTELRNLQIHTKFVPDSDMLPNITKAYVAGVIDRSLKRLCVERLDLVQFHWWDYEIRRYIDAAGWLLDLQHEGKIRHLGVTNFDVEHLRHIVDA